MALNIGRHTDQMDSSVHNSELRKDSRKESDSSFDVLSHFRENLSQLEDLHGRLNFVMLEVEKLVRRRV